MKEEYVYRRVLGDPVPALMGYLHSKMQLTGMFDTTIDPMLNPMEIDRKAKPYLCELTEGVMKTAFWIHEGFGYVTREFRDKWNVPFERIVDVLGPGRIMLHENGFFNNARSSCRFWIAPGSVVVPFAFGQFALLKLSAPEADGLAACILSDNDSLSVVKTNILRLPGELLIAEVERIFSRAIWQHFPQKQLAGYLGVAEAYLSCMRGK